MNRIDVLHINHNSGGTEGLYEATIIQSLEKMGFTQEAFLDSTYPLKNGKKLFYRISNSLKLKRGSLVLNVIKFGELCIDWIIIYFYIVIKRPRIVNHSMLSRFLFPERLFIKAVSKLKGIKVVITCHDVIPFGDNVEQIIKKRKSVLDVADYLIIHSESSKNDLKEAFGVDTSKVLRHPFPLMDMSLIFGKDTHTQKDIDFLFTGFIRKAKGVKILLDAWKEYHQINNDARLVIAGALAHGDLNISEYDNLNIEFKLSFLEPEEFHNLLRRSKYAVFPYIQGTNSGVLYSAIPAGCGIISSDIPMFKSDSFLDHNLQFHAGDSDDLLRVLKSVDLSKDSYSLDIEKYQSDFDESIKNVYDHILGK